MFAQALLRAHRAQPPFQRCGLNHGDSDDRRRATNLKANLTLSLFHSVSTPELYREAFFSTSIPEEQLTAYHARVQDESFRAYVDMMVLDLPRPEKVDTPVLVLGTTKDNLIASSEVEATANAYHTRAEFFPDMKHGMMLDVGWQAVADRMLDWLDEQGLQQHQATRPNFASDQR